MYKAGIIGASFIVLLLGLFYLNSVKNNKVDPIHEKQFSSWREFVPRSGFFKVSLPSFPQYAKDFLSIVNTDQKRRYDMYASEKIDGSLFMINVITYPESVDTSISGEVLQKTLDELMQNKAQNQLIKSEKGVYQKHPALNFQIENQTFHIEGKIVLVGKRVFVLTYTAYKDNFDPIDFQYFINSFQLKDANPTDTTQTQGR